MAPTGYQKLHVTPSAILPYYVTHSGTIHVSFTFRDITCHGPPLPDILWHPPPLNTQFWLLTLTTPAPDTHGPVPYTPALCTPAFYTPALYTPCPLHPCFLLPCPLYPRTVHSPPSTPPPSTTLPSTPLPFTTPGRVLLTVDLVKCGANPSLSAGHSTHTIAPTH